MRKRGAATAFSLRRNTTTIAVTLEPNEEKTVSLGFIRFYDFRGVNWGDGEPVDSGWYFDYAPGSSFYEADRGLTLKGAYSEADPLKYTLSSGTPGDYEIRYLEPVDFFIYSAQSEEISSDLLENGFGWAYDFDKDSWYVGKWDEEAGEFLPAEGFDNVTFKVESIPFDYPISVHVNEPPKPVTPDEPTELTIPDEPYYPVYPSYPSTPSKPSESDKTEEPTEPAKQPEEPAETTTPTQPSTPSVTFTDVAPGAYYADAVNWAVSKGVTTGATATTFNPDIPCTRGDVVTFLYRAAGSPAVAGDNPFTDISSGAYYYNAILWAVQQGITTGVSDNAFDPNATCTRGQIITFLYRYAGSPAATGSSAFTDVADGAYYAAPVSWAAANAIAGGTGDAKFSPESQCTRGQTVTFLYRALA